MYQNNLEEKQYTPFLTAALLAPLLQTASGCSWVVTATLAGITLLLCWGLGKTDCCGENPVWVRIIQWVWISVVMSQMLHWIMHCWPDYDNYHVVPLALLVLAGWAVRKGGACSSRIGCVLLWPLLAVFGLLLLSAGKEIKADYLKPTVLYGNSHLVTVLLIPALGCYLNRNNKKLKQFVGYSAIAVASSIVAMGVLSGNICESADSPIYELSRSIKIFEFAQRLESFAAAALTLGYFLTVLLLLEIQSTMLMRKFSKAGITNVAAPAALTAVLFLLDIAVDSRVLALGSIACWVVLPGLQRIKFVLKNGNGYLTK